MSELKEIGEQLGGSGGETSFNTPAYLWESLESFHLLRQLPGGGKGDTEDGGGWEQVASSSSTSTTPSMGHLQGAVSTR
ncbi:MAG: hypothetical protein ACK56I_34445 [bacterium]